MLAKEVRGAAITPIVPQRPQPRVRPRARNPGAAPRNPLKRKQNLNLRQRPRQIHKQRLGCDFKASAAIRFGKLLLSALGGMCERLKQAVLKTAIPERVSGVRIPLPPPEVFSF